MAMKSLGISKIWFTYSWVLNFDRAIFLRTRWFFLSYHYSSGFLWVSGCSDHWNMGKLIKKYVKRWLEWTSKRDIFITLFMVDWISFQREASYWTFYFCRSVHHREASSLIGCPHLPPPSPLVGQTFLSQNDLLGRQYQVHQGHPRLQVQKDWRQYCRGKQEINFPFCHLRFDLWDLRLVMILTASQTFCEQWASSHVCLMRDSDSHALDLIPPFPLERHHRSIIKRVEWTPAIRVKIDGLIRLPTQGRP